MQTNPLRVGVIGCGRIASVYKDVFTALYPAAQPVFAVDKIPQRAEEFAASFPGCKASANIEDMLAAKPDIVHVLTPHFLHKQHAIQSLQAGCHVLTEKPIATTLPDAHAMAAAAKKCGKQLGVIFQNRYIEGIQQAKKLIQQGHFGRLTGAWSMLNWWRPPSYYDCDWKGSWAKEGGGVVIDQAIHSLDLVRYLMGCEVSAVRSAMDRRVLTNIEVEDVASAAITFENGALYSFFACNYYTSNSPIQIEISGEKGRFHLQGETVTIELENQPTQIIAPAPLENAPRPSYWGQAHYQQIEKFYAAIREDTPVPVSPEDATKTLRLVLDIYAGSGKQSPLLYPG